MELLLSHFLLGISFAVPMGPVNFEAVRRGIGHGFLCAWFVSLGALAADVVYLIAIDQGISVWMSVQWIHMTLTWLGAIFFLQLSYSSIKSSFRSSNDPVVYTASIDPSKWRAFWSGFFIAMVNPISFLFWLGVYGSLYVSLVQNHDSSMVTLCIFFLFFGIAVWNINVATTVHVSRRFLDQKAIRVITFLSGLILFGFGIKFLWKGITFFFSTH